MVEFFEDLWEKNAAVALSLLPQGVESDIVLTSTGDPEWDRIEQQLAAGEAPEKVFADWGVDSAPKAPHQVEGPLVPDKQGGAVEELGEDFADDYEQESHG